MANDTYAIEARGLAKRFGKTIALDGVDLAARAGTVLGLLGLLGPNGAGKTTAVRILATLLRPDAGEARICGFDTESDAHRVRQLIGLTGQYASVDDGLSGANNLVMIGRLLGGRRDCPADHPVPGGGRPARARHRGHRPRQGDRGGHPGRTESGDRQPGTAGHARRP